MPKLESFGNSTCPKIHFGTHRLTITKLAEATKDNRLKSSRPVTTPILPTSCGHEESERSVAEIHTVLMTSTL
ncbi:hypothetical protein JOD43_000086 [Pullulanibacillus pueri]|nr:hypothetical protein [Pullulanibacillus pueri]